MGAIHKELQYFGRELGRSKLMPSKTFKSITSPVIDELYFGHGKLEFDTNGLVGEHKVKRVFSWKVIPARRRKEKLKMARGYELS